MKCVKDTLPTRKQQTNRDLSLSYEVLNNKEVISSKCSRKIIQSKIIHPTKISCKSLRKIRKKTSDTQILREKA